RLARGRGPHRRRGTQGARGREDRLAGASGARRVHTARVWAEEREVDGLACDLRAYGTAQRGGVAQRRSTEVAVTGDVDLGGDRRRRLDDREALAARVGTVRSQVAVLAGLVRRVLRAPAVLADGVGVGRGRAVHR